MYSNDTIDLICELLIRYLPLADYAQGDRWITARCRYCSDSLNPNHKHFGIHIPQHENDVFYYNCFKCHTSGRLTTNDLMAWGIYDLKGIESLSKWNKRVMNKPENRRYLDQIYIVNNSHITMNKLTEAKLKYINNRLGLSLSYTDILSKKIILNLNDFLQENHITRLTRHPNIVSQLSDCFIGFLSQDNGFINMRRLMPEEKVIDPLRKRYINYNIFNKFDNSHRNYTLPVNIKMDDPRPIRLNICEGPFDLLSIFYNINNSKNDHCIYSSINGSSYLQLLENFIIKQKLINLNVHIYKDLDISNNVMYEIKQLLNTFSIPLVVHSNEYPGEKDFGVRKEKIIDKVISI